MNDVVVPLNDNQDEKENATSGTQHALSAESESSLSYTQKRIWVSDAITKGSTVNHIAHGYQIQMTLDKEVLQQSINRVISEQLSLRTVFPEINGEIVSREIPVNKYDLEYRAFNGGDRETWLSEIGTEMEQTDFDLAQLPLFRFMLCKALPDEYYIFIVLHHIIADGISAQVFISSVAKWYFAFQAGIDIGSGATYSCTAYGVWQQSWVEKVREKALSFWESHLGNDSLKLEINETGDKKAGRFDALNASLRISESLNAQMRRLAIENGITPFALYLAAYCILLYKYTGQHTFAVGIPVANRDKLEDQNVIGCYINVLPVRVQIDPQESALGLAVKLADEFASCLDYRHFPFEILAKTFDTEHSSLEHPIFQALFVFQNFEESLQNEGSAPIKPYLFYKKYSEYAITLELHDSRSQVGGFVQCQSAKWNEFTTHTMAEQYAIIAQEMATSPDLAVFQLQFCNTRERQKLLQNSGAVKELPDKLVHEWFECRAHEYPGRTAIVYEQTQLTYDELNLKANQVCHFLKRQGVSPEDAVGILMKPSPEMVTAIMGILKSGAAYVPIDPAFPRQRAKYIMQDAELKVLLYGNGLHDLAQDASCQKLCLDLSDWPLAREPCGNAKTNVTKDNMCYIIYTSGTTGTPKGVINVHKGLLNRLVWMKEAMGFGLDDVFIQKTPFTFDVSVWELILPLMLGAKMVIISQELRRDPFALMDTIVKHGVTVIHFVPSMLEQFLNTYVKEKCESIRTVVCSGEALSKRLADQLLTLSRCRLFNLYGPTEASIDVTWWQCNKEDELVPIGYPIDNVSVLVLDEMKQPVPYYVKGKIYLSGICLAREYKNKSELTAEKFGANPYDTTTALYDSGDCGYLRPDGSVVYLGREDGQVKLYGNRIELEEIEAFALAHPAVQMAKATVYTGSNNSKKLFVFVVAETLSAPQEVMDTMKKSLPYYMIPADVILLDEIPLTLNGKLNTKQLNLLMEETVSTGEVNGYPRNEMEAQLIEIWKKILRVEQVGIYDNFFQMGGDSILCIQFVAEARRQKISIDIQSVYENPTIALLSEKSGRLGTTVADDKRITLLPLSPIQNWFVSDQPSNPAFFNHVMLFDVDRQVGLKQLTDALTRVSQEYDVFSYRYRQTEAGWEAIWTDEPALKLEYIQLSNINTFEKTLYSRVIKIQEQYRLFEDAPLRCVFVDTGTATQNILICIVHHFYIDGYSWNLFLSGLKQVLADPCDALYKTKPYSEWLMEKVSSPVSKDRQQMITNYCRRIQSSVELDGFTILEREISVTESIWEQFDFTLPPMDTKQLKDYVSDSKLRMDTILLNTFCAAIIDFYKLRGIVADYEGYGRFAGAEDISGTIGWFTTVVPVLLLANAEDLDVEKQILFSRRYGEDYMYMVYGTQNCEDRVSSNKGSVLFNFLGDMGNLAADKDLIGISEMKNEFPAKAADTPQKYCIQVNMLLFDGVLQINGTYDVTRISSNDFATIYDSFLNRLFAKCSENSEERRKHVLIGTKDWQMIKDKCKQYPIQQAYPLTPMQEMMLSYYVVSTRKGGNTQVLSCDVSPEISLETLQASLSALVSRHPILRTTFVWRNLQKSAQVVYQDIAFQCEQIDLTDKTEEEAKRCYDDFATRLGSKGMDFTQLPLNRFYIVKRPNAHPKLIWAYLVGLFDNVSWENLVKDIEMIYHSLAADRQPLPYAEFDFFDYVREIARSDFYEMEEFWRTALCGCSQEACPSFVDKTLTKENAPVIQNISRCINQELCENIEAICRKLGITISTYYQCVWTLSLNFYQETDSVLYSILSYGRMNALEYMDTVVGPCANNLPVYVQLDDSERLDVWLKNMQKKMIQVQMHDIYPLYDIAKRAGLPMSVLDTAVQERMFVFTSGALQRSKKLDQMFGQFTNSLQMDVLMRMHVKQEQIVQLELEYNAGKIPKEIPEQLINLYEKLTVHFLNAEQVSIQSLRELCK